MYLDRGMIILRSSHDINQMNWFSNDKCTKFEHKLFDIEESKDERKLWNLSHSNKK